MSPLLEGTEINGMKMPNRFVRSATWEGLADPDGACTPALRDRMAELAEGQVGLIISGHAYVSREGQAGIGQLGIYDDPLMPGLEAMVQAVHERRGRIICQLTHAGFFANAKLTGLPVQAPSQVEGYAKTPRSVMTMDHIAEVVRSFGQAARRAREAGFDGVQIHAAHGYLLSQFLSGAFNKREDVYGGPVENRARALLEALEEIRGVVGQAYPVMVKLNCSDWLPGGVTLPDALRVGAMLEKAGIDAIEVSGGTVASGALGPSRQAIVGEEMEAYFREESKAFKERLGIPILLVGGIRSFALAERLLEEGYADYFSLSRPLIREPHLIKRWAAGDRAKSECLSDSLCFRPGRAGKGVYCVIKEKGRS